MNHTHNNKRAGVGLHISSLPGKHGIGDIADSSLAFLDSLSAMELGVWQFLPTGLPHMAIHPTSPCPLLPATPTWLVDTAGSAWSA